MQRKIIAIAIIVVSIALAVAGWILLPDTVIIQFTVTGNGIRTAPKLVGVAIPLLIGVICGAVAIKNDGKDSYKYLAGGGLGVFIALVSLFVNR